MATMKKLFLAGCLLTMTAMPSWAQTGTKFEDEAVWSWWMPWYQTWGGNFLDQTTNKELTKIMSDTRTIGLSDMPGWDNHTGILSAPVTRKSDEGFYNLKGQRLKKKPSSGLFISGGLVFFAK